VFGYVGNWNPRKNPRAVLEAYIKAFPNGSNSNTALLLKTYNAGNLETYIRDLNNGELREDIWIYDDVWSEEQILWAFNLMDCYVSAHKGEGFGLTLAQAAALGKPVIYTDYSAPTEWLSREKGHYPVKCKVNSVRKEDVSVLYQTMLDESLEWADIDEDHLVETLRSVAESRVKIGFAPQDLESFRKLVDFNALGSNLIRSVESIVGTSLERLTNEK
jgi:glycosyltransferase involved in cell wall biosynthesis